MKSLVSLASCALLCAAASAAVPGYDTFIAHRGESHDAPENTLPAYKMAVERGFGFECDLYLSRDKRVFSFHDRNLARTTGGACTQQCAQASWADTISKVDVGGWGKWKGSKYSPTRPALLEEILPLARDGRFIYVEIKAGPEIVPYVKDIFARQTQAHPGNVRFICFNRAVCRELKRLMPEYRLYWLVSAGVRPRDAAGKPVKGAPIKFHSADYVLAGLKESCADGVDIEFNPAAHDAAFVKKIRDAGYGFHVWTVDRLEMSLKAFACGAETVTTNCAKKQLDAYTASR